MNKSKKSSEKKQPLLNRISEPEVTSISVSGLSGGLTGASGTADPATYRVICR